MEQQDLFLRLSMFEQQIKNLYQQFESIEKGVVDLDSIKINLDEIKGKKGSEIFAQVGRGIFVKAKLESEELILDVGEGKFITKDVEGVKETLDKQISRLRETQKEIESSIESLNKELNKTMEEYQSKSKK